MPRPREKALITFCGESWHASGVSFGLPYDVLCFFSWVLQFLQKSSTECQVILISDSTGSFVDPLRISFDCIWECNPAPLFASKLNNGLLAKYFRGGPAGLAGKLNEISESS